jgi:hydrogenase maturation protease
VIETGEYRTRVLVIGYGNPLRRDDGLGPLIVDGLAAERRAGVETITAVQLVPELAASLAEAEVVIFVDACAGSGEVQLTLVEEGEALEWSSHCGDPRALLALTRAVYGRAPRAWWVTVPGVDFGFGDGLSPAARANTPVAGDCIKALLLRLVPQ